MADGQATTLTLLAEQLQRGHGGPLTAADSLCHRILLEVSYCPGNGNDAPEPHEEALDR